jgi:nucleotide-binding universal stress UspA family protein
VSRVGVRHALNAARELDAEVLIYHVVRGRRLLRWAACVRNGPSPKRGVGLLETYEIRLRRFLKKHFADAVTRLKIKSRADFGSPEKKIVETAKAEKVDLIIMATSRKGAFERMISGSVTEKVIRKAPCPVLSVPVRSPSRRITISRPWHKGMVPNSAGTGIPGGATGGHPSRS